MTLREADLLENLLTKTVVEYKRSLTITQNQYNAGTAAKSDVITAETLVLNAQAAADRSRSVARPKRTRDRGPDGPAARGPVDPAGQPWRPAFPRSRSGLPSSLLERRPDVAAAEETMRQANAEIGVEFAGYFPAVSLNGLIGYSGNPFAAEFGPSNPVWSFGSSLAQPLFNGGSHHGAGRGGPPDL